MHPQIRFALQLFTFAGAYLFTRSRTPPNRRRYPEKSVAVLFVLEHLKWLWLFNRRLIAEARNQTEILDGDIRLFKAFLEDYQNRSNQDPEVQDLAEQIRIVVAQSEPLLALARRLTVAKHHQNFLQKHFSVSMDLRNATKDLHTLKAEVKRIYAKSSAITAARKRRQAA